MKKRNILMSLGAIAAIGAPLAAVVSCGLPGNNKKDETKPVVNKGGNTTDGQSTSSTISVRQNDSVALPTIGESFVKQGYSSAEVEQGIFSHMQPESWNSVHTVYPVKMKNTSHTINFSFDNSIHWSKEEAIKLINTWAISANYGYGILTLDTIFITDKPMGSAGWGGAGKDILVASKDLATISDEISKGKEKQITFQTLLHEYGHHETTSLIDGSGEQQTKDLIANNVIGTKMFNNTVADPAAEKARLTSLLGSSRLEDIEQKFFGPQNGNTFYGADANYLFDMPYHMGTHLEFLNRVMNIVELNVLDKNNMGGLYGFADLIKYQIGEDRKMLNDDGTYTEAAKQLINLYGEYVYGYSSYGMKYSLWTVKGFSNTDFDFVKATIAGQAQPKVVGVEKIESHYISKDKLFGEIKTINHSTAYSATLQTGQAYDVTSVEFYQDTNKNGQLDDQDQKVEINASKTRN